MTFKMKPIEQNDLSAMLQRAPSRGRTSKGAELIQEFLSSGNVAATVELGSTKERNSVAISATNFCRGSGSEVWVRKLGGGTGTELLLINLAKANAETRKAYESRPRPGRRPAKR